MNGFWNRKECRVLAIIGGLWWICMFLGMHPLKAQQRGEWVSDSLLQTLDSAQIASVYQQIGLPVFLAPIKYELEIYRLVYRTPAVKGDSLTLASGLVVLPKGNCNFPLFVYNHGTVYYGFEVSRLGGEWQVAIPYAANGYFAVLPDYLGYGDTPLEIPHPYLHARSEASACVDMMKAAKQWARDQQVRLSKQVFMAGYSQGAHVTLATQRLLEAEYTQEFPLTAVSAGSGPYDLSGTMTQGLLSPVPSSSFLLGFVMTSYQYVYENLWNQPADAFIPPYDQAVPQYFYRPNPQPNVSFPDTAVNMLQPAYYQAIQADSLHPVRVALRKNDVYRWAPQAPLRLYYCESDDLVPYENSIVARDSFLQRGATQVSAQSAGSQYGHESCFAPTLISTKLWFDQLKDTCIKGLSIDTTTTSVSGIPTEEDLPLATGIFHGDLSPFSFWPNPVKGEMLHIKYEVITMCDVRIFDSRGKTVKRFRLPSGTHQTVLNLNGINPGIYSLIIEADGKVSAHTFRRE